MPSAEKKAPGAADPHPALRADLSPRGEVIQTADYDYRPSL